MNLKFWPWNLITAWLTGFGALFFEAAHTHSWWRLVLASLIGYVIGGGTYSTFSQEYNKRKRRADG